MNWKQLALSGAAAITFLALGAQSASAQLQATAVGGSFSAPLYVTSPPGDTDRLFVLEQNSGRIRIIKNGTTLGTPFIDLGAISSSGSERGLLGLAFHPNYFGPGTGEGEFFVNYTNNSGNTVVRRYDVSANPDVADAGSFQNIVTITQPFSNHNGGCIQFGPDGMLYVGTGDGGSANDPGNRSQNINNLLGKMLRYDVDLPSPFIPASNPFVGVAGDDAIWSIGQRNPWRFSFDRVTGDMWIGDVGQGEREEVSFEPAGSAGGLNYGWRCMEGLRCTGLSGCTCNSAALTLPVEEYNHGGGRCSITGGYRYRGTAMPNFVGRYFFADYCSGQIWSVAFNGTSTSDLIDHESDIGIGGFGITSFGEDANGELYIIKGSNVYRLDEECLGGFTNYCTGAVNSSGGGAQIGFFGSTSVSDDNVNLSVSGCPSGVPGLFFMGPNQVSAPFGNGFLCAGGGITRIPPPITTDFLGTATKSVPLGSSPGNIITANSTWNFQYWFRDVPGGGSMFNTSDGISVDFCP